MNLSKKAITTVAILCLISAAGMASAASISGTIHYEGRMPNLRPLDMSADPNCQAKHSTPPKSEIIVLGEGNTLANVFVSVKSGLPDQEFPVPSEPVVLDQHGCIYVPHVLGLMAGQKLKVLNSDGTLHNIHSFSKVNPPVNKAMPGAVKEAEFPFDKPEDRFEIKCDVHPWMSAFVYVTEHPFFSVSGKDGTFEIEGLPAGTYEIEARHEFQRFPPQTVTVTVGADEEKSGVDFTFKGPSS